MFGLSIASKFFFVLNICELFGRVVLTFSAVLLGILVVVLLLILFRGLRTFLRCRLIRWLILARIGITTPTIMLSIRSMLVHRSAPICFDWVGSLARADVLHYVSMFVLRAGFTSWIYFWMVVNA